MTHISSAERQPVNTVNSGNYAIPPSAWGESLRSDQAGFIGCPETDFSSIAAHYPERLTDHPRSSIMARRYAQYNRRDQDHVGNDPLCTLVQTTNDYETAPISATHPGRSGPAGRGGGLAGRRGRSSGCAVWECV
ncbi:hypothetical protein C351_05545 [Cryptococcus neoformans c8]|nr:hypothetical protein C351_05545 [Cryptococcus neoformans var. grubii c8]